MRVHSLLKQESANATQSATEDQASDHSAQSSPHRTEFDLEVTEEPPTSDQLKSIIEYIGPNSASSVVEGATDINSALRKLRESKDNFKRPVVRHDVSF